MDEQSAKELIRKYLEGTCSEQERRQVERFYNEITQPRKDLFEEEHLNFAAEQSWQRFQQHLHPNQSQPRKRLYAYAAAAAVVIVLAIGYRFIVYKNEPSETPRTNLAQQDVPPGGNNAILTLANGQKINLSQAPNGTVINRYINIKKKNDGEVVYTSSNSSAARNEVNMIATPKGGQYIVQLSDGSKVWLNAQSQIKFPADFKNLKNRSVELTGEAYFEVAKDPARPFIVKTTSQEVQVLGTHFNINAYADEPFTKTSLLEGSVKITPKVSSTLSTQLKSAILKPGQEALLHQNNEIKIQQADADAAASWKDGMIKVRNAQLQAILRQVSRWYNIEVVYKGTGKYENFTGTIPTNTNLSDLIKVLESKNLHFTINTGPTRTLIVESKP